jgi:hypothetical protein
MVLRVQYHNYNYDYVNAATLDRLIASKGIIKFLRPSEDRWVDIDKGPLRSVGSSYSGPERRQAPTPF